MPGPAAKKAEGINLSFVVARKPNGATVALIPSRGQMIEIAIDESSDPALELHERLKKTKGRDENGRLLYSESALFVRPRTNRRLRFRGK